MKIHFLSLMVILKIHVNKINSISSIYLISIYLKLAGSLTDTLTFYTRCYCQDFVQLLLWLELMLLLLLSFMQFSCCCLMLLHLFGRCSCLRLRRRVIVVIVLELANICQVCYSLLLVLPQLSILCFRFFFSQLCWFSQGFWILFCYFFL